MKRFVYFAMFLVMVLALPVSGQQTGSSKSGTSNAKSHNITVDGVIALVQAQVSDDVIIARLRSEGKSFDLSPNDMIRLKQAKVSDAVLKVMLDPSTPAAPPAAVQPVVVQTSVLPGVTPPAASGATPAPGSNVSGDPNDPMVPHDSGIYLYTKDHAGNPQMVLLDRASYQGAKSGGVFASELTYGIKKVKTKAVIPGPHAGIRVIDSPAVFYFYFDDKQAGLGKSNFGLNSLSNPNQFALLHLEVNKSNRETIIGAFSVWGSSSGSDSGAMVPFKSERVRTGLYKVAADGLKTGEYCFYAAPNSQTTSGPYTMTTSGGSADIFDFGVDLQ